MIEPFHIENIGTYKHQTPFFLFSKQKIVDNYKKYVSLFETRGVHYAIKANAEPEVIRILDGLGSGFEVASVYEMQILKELGVSANKIIYGTSVKPASHIKESFEYGVDRFACDSEAELEKIAENAPGSKVYVRVRVNDSGSVFKFSEKFGTGAESVVPLLRRAKELDLIPYGISFHVGSQASNAHAWASALDTLREPMNELRSFGIEIEAINIGGGYPCNYHSTEDELTLEKIAEHTMAAYKNLPYQPELILEPGRGIIADTAVLVTEVIARVERAENTWLFLDAGVYNALFESMAYQGSTRYKITSMKAVHDAGEKLFSLAGPTGDSPDIVRREILLPADMNTGDKLVIHSVGAYSLVVASRFNGFPKPAVYYV